MPTLFKAHNGLLRNPFPPAGSREPSRREQNARIGVESQLAKPLYARL
jgi:hypothetical protein